jgi:hypothetical protein
MNLMKKALILGLFSFALASCTSTIPSVGNEYRKADGYWGPGTSVPQVYMSANGDRVGHYAPYFYPDTPGGSQR